MCLFRALGSENLLSHLLQPNCLAPVRIISCSFKLDLLLNLSLHYEQLKGVSSVWTRWRFFKLVDVENFLLHFRQSKSFSPVWILSCVFKWCFKLELLPHFKHLCGFFINNHTLCSFNILLKFDATFIFRKLILQCTFYFQEFLKAVPTSIVMAQRDDLISSNGWVDYIYIVLGFL